MIGQTLWTEFFSNRDWPVASAIAVALLGLLLVPILFYERLQQRSLGGDALMKRGVSPFNIVRSPSAWPFSICRSSFW